MYARFRFTLTSLAIFAALFTLAAPPAPAQVSPLGDDFAVNSYTPGDQSRPAVASRAGGGAVAAWAGRRPFPFTSDERDGIFVQRFDPEGRPVGPEVAAVWLTGDLKAGPAVATTADGSFVVVWVESNSTGTENRLFASRYSARGNRLFSHVEIDTSTANILQPAVATTPAGGFAVAWQREEEAAPLITQVFARGFQSDGAPQALSERISSGIGRQYGPSVAALPEDRYVVVWTSARLSGPGEGIVGRLLGPDGTALSDELPIDDTALSFEEDPAVAAVGPSSFAVVWEEASSYPQSQIFGRIFSNSGQARGSAFLATDVEEGISYRHPTITGDSGNMLIGWDRQEIGVVPVAHQPVLRAFSLIGKPLSPRLSAGSDPSVADTEFHLAALAPDRFLAVWERGPIPPGSPLSLVPSTTLDEDGSAIVGRAFDFSADRLYLNQDRFRLEVDWDTPAGAKGRGRAIALSRDTGTFWFFNRENVELTVKVLDGRPVNGSFWVFYGSLTNVNFTLTVTDTETGAQNQYHNPQGTLRSRADTNAFPEALVPLSSLASSTEGTESALSELALPVMFEDLAPALATKAAAGCTTGGESLCLNGKRFLLEIDWTDPRSGDSGRGTAVNLTDDTGYFWFFNRDNVELIVKVLDGRPVNGNFWVFFGALSDLEYTLTVTDTETGAQRTYFNPPFELTSLADTAAF